MDTKTVVTDINLAVAIAEKIAEAATAFAPDAAIGGVALSKIVSAGEAAAAGAQDAIDYIANMKALAASTSAPTPEQWAALDAQTDADVEKLEDSTSTSA